MNLKKCYANSSLTRKHVLWDSIYVNFYNSQN